ncbi:MAG: imidazolonepropionase, partial [Chitinophagaceae bacterium]|nr:imidazolonepropionase [Chitinophagaceae bacterium]
MATLFTNIKVLVNVRTSNKLLRGRELKDLPTISNAYLIVEGNEIADYGKMNELEYSAKDFAFHLDAAGKFILPSWCDSHTHLVFAGSREDE